MSYVILSDSTCSLSDELIKECDVKIISLSFIINDEEHKGSDEKEMKFFYDELRKKGNATTSCVNAQGFLDFFEEELKKGNDIINLAFSSALSATYQNSLIAVDELKEKYPERTIISIDSLSASAGEGLILYHAGLLRKQGKTIYEVATWIEENKLKVCHLFTVEDLFFLYRGGRVKPTAYLLANVLNVKPLMYVPNDGSLQPYGKVIGRKRSIVSLVEELAKTIVNPEEQTIFISHGDCIEDVEFAMKKIKEKVNVKGFKVVYVDPVIGTHSGPGTLAIFFFGESRDIK